MQSAMLVAGVTASNAIPWSGAAAESVGGLTADERSVVIQLARTIATAPVSFPDFGERGPAVSRVTDSRLTGALSRLEPERQAQTRGGIALLVSAGLTGSPTDRLVAGVGELVHTRRQEVWTQLRAVVALAVTVVSTRFDPHANPTAELWLDFTRHFHLRRVAIPA